MPDPVDTLVDAAPVLVALLVVVVDVVVPLALVVVVSVVDGWPPDPAVVGPGPSAALPPKPPPPKPPWPSLLAVESARSEERRVGKEC